MPAMKGTTPCRAFSAAPARLSAQAARSLRRNPSSPAWMCRTASRAEPARLAVTPMWSELLRRFRVLRGIAVLAGAAVVQLAQVGHRIGDLVRRNALRGRLV